MILTRRQFAAAAFGGVLAPIIARPALADVPRSFAGAIDAIRAFGARHLVYYGLPGMTLSLMAPDGFATVLNFGFADREAHRAIGPDTLFQIGSISKFATAAVIHQLAAEGRLQLDAPVETVVPGLPLPRASGITIQQLLDHTSGLASDVPLDAPGGFWLGFVPGTRWAYSNTGYEILGKVAEKVEGKPLAAILKDRLFDPLAMRRSRGAILAADRNLYAQGYVPDETIPYARGAPLGPAPWIDFTFGAGSIASTGADMVRLMGSLAEVAAGRGGLGLDAARGRVFAAHDVPTGVPGLSYGNGLMKVSAGGRSYLHHTGGMIGFSSAFHLDPASGVAAFASTTLAAFAEYRPRSLTLYAVDTLTRALAGRAPAVPPRVDTPVPNPAMYLGRYTSGLGSFEVVAGSPLTIIAGGQSAPLQPWGGDLFRTLHPLFRQFTLRFDRTATGIAGATWGSATYTRTGHLLPVTPSDPKLASLAGRFTNPDPWYGTITIVERGGRLWVGTDGPMTPIAGNQWRVGEEPWSPERASFADFAGGQPQTLIYSGVRFRRSV